MASLARAFVLAVAAGSFVTSQAATAVLEPHRASYRLSLDNTNRASGLTGVSGGLVIEWKRSCDGWLSHQRLAFVASVDGGPDFSHDVRFSSWESLDGDTMRYTVRGFEGDELREEYRGEAHLDGDGGAAVFITPDEREIALPTDTVFPTEHIKRVLAAADERLSFVSHDVFDGWGYDALTQVTSVIGKTKTVETGGDDVEAGGADETFQAWPVSMAYYGIAEASDQPEFEAVFLLTEKGVLRELALDYGDFKLKAEVDQIKYFDRPAC